jgi:hypothetical protein
MEARDPAVLEVLRGRPTAEVAGRFDVDLQLARALVAAHGGTLGAEDGIALWVRLPVGG